MRHTGSLLLYVLNYYTFILFDVSLIAQSNNKLNIMRNLSLNTISCNKLVKFVGIDKKTVARLT